MENHWVNQIKKIVKVNGNIRKAGRLKKEERTQRAYSKYKFSIKNRKNGFDAVIGYKYIFL